MNYTEIDAMLSGRHKQQKKYANNTYLVRREDHLALLYHSTDVVKFYSNGDIVLDNGGWYTSTTKERIAWMLAGTQFGIHQEHGVWYIVKMVDGRLWNRANPQYRFNNGMILHTKADTVTGYIPDSPKADRQLKAKVKKYAQLCADSVPLDKPGGGDCWFCAMSTQNGDSLGDATKNTNHLDSHMKESYIVPSLVYRALKESGNSNMITGAAFSQVESWFTNIARQRVQKSVYCYILRRKGYAV